MKKLALSIISIVVVLFIVLTLPTSSVWAATYFLRADGTAANKAAATLGASASTAMSVATHNSQTFIPGDIIYLSDKGGTYKLVGIAGSAVGIVAPSSGDDGYPIVYKNVPGETPVIDTSYDISAGRIAGGYGSDGWTEIRTGVYQSNGYCFGRVLWEDGVALQRATSSANVGVDGSWYYQSGSGYVVYAPSSGTPTDHSVKTIWYTTANWDPYGFDLRNRSNIEVSGLTCNYCTIGHGNNTATSPASLMKNIKIHDNIFNYSPWAIWSNLKNNGVEQDVEIYNNTINYCNGGISAWCDGSSTTGATQHPLRHNIHNNTINYHYSIDSTHDWGYALGAGGSGIDHEAISFQDGVDCTVADNLISESDSITQPAIPTRAIFFYMTDSYTKTSGNKVLRNRMQGRYYPAVYIAGTPDATFGGFENNTFACNVLQCSNITKPYMAFWFYTDTFNNTATGMNYWCNNTINYANGAGGEGKQALFMRYEDPGYWTFKNNIIVAPAAVNTYSNGTTKNIFDHNNYYNTESNPFTYYTTPKTFTQWQELSANFDNVGSSSGTNPMLRSTDSALTTLSPTWCINGGTPIEGVTVISGVGQLGIDGKAFDPANPAMGAYAQPANDNPSNTTGTTGTTSTGNYTISPTSQSFSAAGGTGSIKISGDAVSPWLPTSNVPWIIITAPQSQVIGIGTVTYQVQPMTSGKNRNGTITVAGFQFAVNQQAAVNQRAKK